MKPSIDVSLLPPQRYFSIGEVSKATQVKPYVLRYWETQFSFLRPPRRDSGQRKFTQKEVDLILQIKELLYEKKFTVAGAKRWIIQENRKGKAQLKLDLGLSPIQAPSETLDSLRQIRQELEEALKLLRK